MKNYKRYITTTLMALSTIILSGCDVKPQDIMEGQTITYFQFGNYLIGIAWFIILVVCILGIVIVKLKYKNKPFDEEDDSIEKNDLNDFDENETGVMIKLFKNMFKK